MRYLCQTRDVADNWYPKDLKARVKVDEYLDRHHCETRVACAGYIFRKVMCPPGRFPEEEIQKHLDMQKPLFTRFEGILKD